MDFTAYFISVICLLYKYHGSVSSWGRTEKHNKDVGGVPGSLHLLWLGCDVVLDVNEKNLEFEKDAQLMGFTALWETNHYHLQPK